MTKKDYELIATPFRKELENLNRLFNFKVAKRGQLSSFNEGQVQELRTVIQLMAFYLQQDNPKFDKEKFLTACGVKLK